LQRATHIAHSYLAGYVREIVHHEGSFAYQNPDMAFFTRTLMSHRRREDYPKDLKKLHPKHLYDRYLEEIEEAKLFEGFNGAQMQKIFQTLPNLVTLVCLPYIDEWNDPETSVYTLKRVGLSYLPMESSKSVYEYSSNTLSFFQAARTRQLKVLNLSLFSSFAIRQLVSNSPQTNSKNSSDEGTTALTHVQTWLCRLELLTIGTQSYSRHTKLFADSNAWNSDIDLILEACNNITNLELTSGFTIWDRDPLLPSNTFPKLHTLTLSHETFGEKALKVCISSLRRSLRHLHFHNIGLASRRNAQHWSHESMVEMLYNISPALNLQSCTGLITVRCMQTAIDHNGWELEAKHHPRTMIMIQKVQEAACHERTWPDVGEPVLSSSGKRDPKVRDFFYKRWDEMEDLFDETGEEHCPLPWATDVDSRT